MLGRLTRLLRRSIAVVMPHAETIAPPVVLPTFAGDLAAAGVSNDAWCRRRRSTSALYSTIRADAITLLRRRHADRVAATVEAASRVRRHEFELLGSGPYDARDPDRPSRNGYVPIDWYLDPVRRLRFPRGVPYQQWNLYEMRPANADIKYPWELARCQHWVVLGQAHLLTNDSRFALEIAH